MAENILETRILLRYGTYSQWMNSNVILRLGEPAICSFPYSRSIEGTNINPENTPPAIGIKIGDGTHYFDELPWVQAIAADVYSWAKTVTKPSYTASEIQGLDSYIEEHAPGGGGSGGTVAARLYQLTPGTGENQYKYYLQYKTSEDGNWIIDTNHYIDLEAFVKVANWIGNDVNEFYNLGTRTGEHIDYKIGLLDYNDSVTENLFVTSVSETDGIINVTKGRVNFSDLTGVLSPEQGGTGLSEILPDTVPVGNNAGRFSLRDIDSEVDNTNHLVTNAAVKSYVDAKTAGLTGAMHFIGEATIAIENNANVDPRINGYNFSSAQLGDVILSGQKEFVWTGYGWQLLGDEGSYAVKGSIVNADISADAAIDQSKIANLDLALDSKVDKIEGKQLSTEDYTHEEKVKLEEIEPGAQVNAIEHVFVNDIERPITTVNGSPKSITLSIDVFDEEHATKLDGIQAGAQVNTIEHIFVNGTEAPIKVINNLSKSAEITVNEITDAERQKLTNIENGAQVNRIETLTINGTTYNPNASKAVEITLDQAALNLNVLEGAQYPASSNSYADIEVVNKKLRLSHLAATGNVEQLLQTNDTYITLDCGSSTEVI